MCANKFVLYAKFLDVKGPVRQYNILLLFFVYFNCFFLLGENYFVFCLFQSNDLNSLIILNRSTVSTSLYQNILCFRFRHANTAEFIRRIYAI